MNRLFLVLATLGGMTALTAFGATAAPAQTGIHVPQSQPLVTQVDYYWHHHHFHHRHWEHDHWRYYD